MKKFALALIRWYKRNISPLQPPSCRFIPTCSEYTYQAIERFGVFKGCLLGAGRILRCNPFFKGGFDPVPEEFSLFKKRKSKQGDDNDGQS